jgi:TPR repeat protein
MPKSVKYTLVIFGALGGLLLTGFIVMVGYIMVTGSASGLRTARALQATSPPTVARTASSTTPPGDATPLAADEFSAKLDALEKASRHADLAEVLFDKAKALTQSDRQSAVAWLESRLEDPNMPVLFLLAKLHEAQGDLDQSSRWFVAAAVVGHIDAVRCEDVSAASAITTMKSLYTTTTSHLRANALVAEDARKFAMDFEEEHADRPPALWIARHGMAAYQGKAPAFITDAAWAKERTRLRAELQK